MGTWKTFLLVGLAVLVGTAAALGQISASTGAIQGVVNDPQGALVPGAKITLTNTDTGVVAGTAQSDSHGVFTFPLLVPGNYKIQVQSQGFSTSLLTGIRVEVTKVTTAKAKLQIGQVTSEITVTGAAQLVDTSTATTGDVMEASQVQSTPLPTRNFLDLTQLQAGVAATMESAAVVGKGAPTLYVAGQRSTDNNLVLDGIDANDFHGQALTTVPTPNPDAVAEFRVNTSMYDASQGRNSGGNINVVIRSGTDKYHGELFEFNRNTDYNANDFFFNAAGAPRPTLQQNQFGGTIGGPVPKLKDTFWFFSYQGTRQNNGVSSAVSGSQPVLPSRTGATNASYTSALATAFGVNAANIDPVAVNLLLAPGPYGGYLFPSGNCATAGCNPGSIGTVNFSLPTIYSDNQYVTSIDHQFTRDNRFSFKYFTDLSTELQPIGGTTLGQGLNTPANNYHLAISDSQTFSPNLLNQIDAGYTYVRNATVPIEGVTVGQIGETKWDSATYSGIPNILFAGGANALSFGGPGVNDSVHGGSASITFNDTLSWTHGNHSLRFGTQFRRYRWNYENDFSSRGAITFADFNSFLDGSFDRLQVGVGQEYHEYRALDGVGFVQDDWRATRRLTLNLGLRYDHLGFPIDAQDHLGNFDLSLVPQSCIAAGGGTCMEQGFIAPAGAPVGLATPGVSDNTLIGSNNLDFSPRLGFAYDLLGNGKVSLRGGYGIFDIRTSGNTVLQLQSGPPFAELYESAYSGVTQGLANPWPAGLLNINQFPQFPPIGQFEGTFDSKGNPLFLNSSGVSVPQVGMDGLNRRVPTPYVQQWNLDSQTALAKNWVLELGYIGSHAIKLLDQSLTNQSLLASPTDPFTYTYTPPGGGTPVVTTITTNSAANAPLRSPLLGFSPSGPAIIESKGYSFYDGIIVEVRHPFAKSFQFKMDYTWSKSIDNVSSDQGSFVVNELIPGLSKAVSDFNQPQRLVFTYMWNLPGPRTGWASWIGGGWETTGVYTIQSGLPFSVTSSSAGSLEGLEGSGIGTGNTAACTGPVVNSGSTISHLTSYLNPSCFAAVPTLASGTVVTGLNPQSGPGSQSFTVGPSGAGDPGTGTLLGDAPRNGWQGPLDSRFDMSMMKNFGVPAMGEQGNLQIRIEGFKVFNNVNFSNPAANINSSTFGYITSTLDKTGRLLQFSLKLSF